MRHAFAITLAVLANLLLFLGMVRMVDTRFTGWGEVAEVLSLEVVSLPDALPPPDRAPPDPAAPELQREPRLEAPQLSFEPLDRDNAPDTLLVAMPPVKFELHGTPFLGSLAPPLMPGASPLTPNVRVEPVYPRRAQVRGIEGYVVVGFTVNPDGTTSQLEILDSLPPITFDRAALKAVERWRFEPQAEPRKESWRFEFELGS